jgi:hypothetical protein
MGYINVFRLCEIYSMYSIVPDTASRTSEDECKWWKHQIIYFPETINTMNTMSLRIFTHFLLEGYAHQLTLCMLAFWSHEGVVFLVFLPSPHLITSFHLPCLGSTDAHCPRLGVPVPLPPKWRPFPQGPRTLPYRGSEQVSTGCI